MKRSKMFSFVALAAIMLFVGACSDDSNPTKVPEFGTITGRVTFSGNWPAVGNVQVSIWTAWPPMSAPYQATPIIPANSVTYDYKFEGLERGAYKAITVGWRDPANPAGARVLGIYVNDPSKSGLSIDTTTGRPTYELPVTIDIADAKMVWNGLDIKADLSFAQ